MSAGFSRPVPRLMIQGTGSHVGKSLLVAGLCRALTRRGLQVRPFKPQNMSNNAAVAEGGEIGRAQALQARAAGVSPTVDMNPVLLKPEGEGRSQIVLQGRVHAAMSGADYQFAKAELLPAVLESFQRLGAGADLVLVEGAGSPAEINLRAGDVANMGFAVAADCPVVLAGDIDRGGVIASLVGTRAVIDPTDAALIKGFLVNKFRGDPKLFGGGVVEIERRTGWPCLGVVPWFAGAADLPAEDSLGVPTAAVGAGELVIAVPHLPRIANFDDLDPLRLEPNVRLTMVEPGRPIPAEARLVLLVGSKSTVADLAVLRREGWDIDIRAHVRRGGRVLGLCGGYQMLGRTIADPGGLEGPAGSVDGLGLLDVTTELIAEKTTDRVEGRHIASGTAIAGYEIHLGRTVGPDCTRRLLDLGGRGEGAMSADGLVAGSYVHGLFGSDAFRRAFLAELGTVSVLAYDTRIDAALDGLAAHLEAHVDIDRLLQIAGVSEARQPGRQPREALLPTPSP